MLATTDQPRPLPPVAKNCSNYMQSIVKESLRGFPKIKYCQGNR
jgi:hypothetical protein